MTVQTAREALIELERERQQAEAELDAKRAEFEQALADKDKLDREQALRQHQIKQARADLEREERLEASREQAAEVHTGVDSLIRQFKSRADGTIWYDGIFPHQWQAMMFGAVAKRWILGDAMGLGKTRTAIGWLDLIDAQRIIVLTEANLTANFEGELMELAPERVVYNLRGQTPETRHELLDESTALDTAVIIVNHEIFRRDRDALGKLMAWQADTLIVDEAHALKSTKTANFKNAQLLVAADNTCPCCGALIAGLWDAEALRHVPPRKVAKPCAECGWKNGDDTGHGEYKNKLDAKLATRSVQNLLLMTGTPILNEPIDLFSLLHLCDPILFNTKNSFLSTYCSKNYHADKWEFRTGAVKRLRPLIEGRFMARTLDEVGIELPKQHIHVVPVELDKRDYPLQYRTIRQISDAAQIVLSDGRGASIMHLLSLITRKRQANVWPGGIEIKHPQTGEIMLRVGDEVQESAKIDELVAKATMIFSKTSQRQVVFSQFKEALIEIERRLKAEGYRVVRYDGDTPQKLREEIRTNFYRGLGETAKWDFVLAHYRSGGAGLNLTSAEVTHILDEAWNPGRRDQAYGRTNRIGQTEETEVYIYRIPRSIDTWMSNGNHRKERMIAGFNSDMVEDEHEISAESLRNALKNGEIL